MGKTKELFDEWNGLKKEIDEKVLENFHIRPREIWYIHMWKNIWFESNGKSQTFKRPVLVLKIIWTMLFVVSMTTKGKNNKFYYKIPYDYFQKDSYVTLSQIKTIDRKRFIEKVWKISVEDFLKVKKELKEVLF